VKAAKGNQARKNTGAHPRRKGGSKGGKKDHYRNYISDWWEGITAKSQRIIGAKQQRGRSVKN